VVNQEDASGLVKLIAANDDPRVQFTFNGLRARFQKKIPDFEQRKEFVYLLAQFGKSFHFLLRVPTISLTSAFPDRSHRRAGTRSAQSPAFKIRLRNRETAVRSRFSREADKIAALPATRSVRRLRGTGSD
jgi:hypothetical protein